MLIKLTTTTEEGGEWEKQTLKETNKQTKNPKETAEQVKIHE